MRCRVDRPRLDAGSIGQPKWLPKWLHNSVPVRMNFAGWESSENVGELLSDPIRLRNGCLRGAALGPQGAVVAPLNHP